MKDDFKSLMAADQVGPCTPTCCPRTTCPGHVVTPSCDLCVVVQAQTRFFFLEQELLSVTSVLRARGTISDKMTAIKNVIDPVFAKVKSDIKELMNKTGGHVYDDKAAQFSRWSDSMHGGPPWRHETEMCGCGLLGWNHLEQLDCNAIDTSYRIASADCAQLLFDDHIQYRTHSTDSSFLDFKSDLDFAVRNHIAVSSSDDPLANQTDLAVVIVPGMGDVTTCTFLLVPDFMVRRTLVRDTWCPTA